METLFSQTVLSANSLFSNGYLDTRMLYLQSFNTLPSLAFMNNMDGEMACRRFREKFAHLIKYVHVYNSYDSAKKKYQFDKTAVILSNKMMIEFDEYYCELLHDGLQDKFVSEITMFVSQFKKKQRRQPLEINLIVPGRTGLDLKGMEVKRTKLDIDLFYEDDFKPVDQLIRHRLNKKNDKGIVLLHGLPGTGKTTYLRNLIGRIKKRVLFLSPSVADNLMNPEFIELLVDNPNTVLIIEDAENIMMDRKHNSCSSVSNLLNISDGLLSDFLNVQLICTFNSSLTLIDNALMRKGRLIARYEFGKLGQAKAQKLSRHFGFDTNIDRPMSIAEIANQHEQDQKIERVEVLGFRRDLAVN
jgi:ATPase family associated with various cellular activities (AAA)